MEAPRSARSNGSTTSRPTPPGGGRARQAAKRDDSAVVARDFDVCDLRALSGEHEIHFVVAHGREVADRSGEPFDSLGQRPGCGLEQLDGEVPLDPAGIGPSEPVEVDLICRARAEHDGRCGGHPCQPVHPQLMEKEVEIWVGMFCSALISHAAAWLSPARGCVGRRPRRWRSCRRARVRARRG